MNTIHIKDAVVRHPSARLAAPVTLDFGADEHLALVGPNGAGKSTLLSLVCADNPQSYACDIALFGRKRGSGESIWDIKRHIGYVSPEMHRAYLKNLPAIEIVASGLHDSIGLYKRPRPEQMDTCLWWMDLFGMAHLHGLDTYHRRRVKSIIEAFCTRRGKTLIMVTHYPEELPDVITHRLELHRHASYSARQASISRSLSS